MYRKFTATSLLLMLLSIVSHSQSDRSFITVSDSWSFQRQSISEISEPPVNWSYDGTIILEGKYGIHGVNSRWETSKILAFTNIAAPGNGIYNGAISPDKLFYAAAEGKRTCDGTCVHNDTFITKIHVFDISGDDPRKFQTIHWNLYYSSHASRYDEPNIQWLDETHIGFPSPTVEKALIANPFTGEVVSWEAYPNSRQSPDRTRITSYDWLDPKDGQSFYPQLKDQNGELLHVYKDVGFEFLGYWDENWSPDSNLFLASKLEEITEEDLLLQSLLLYDRDGEKLDTIMTFPGSNFEISITYPFDALLSWASDNKRFMIRLGQTPVGERNLYLDNFTTFLVDTEHKAVTDICLSERVSSLVWSPDNQFIAAHLLENDQLTIVDLEQLKHYKIARGDFYQTLGWRSE